MGNLTARRRLFAHEYLIDLNGTKAAIRAGFSEKRASVEAAELLKDPQVAALIEQLKAERIKRVEADSDMVLRDLLEYRDADIRQIYNENDTLKPIHEWPAFFTRLGVVSIKTREEFQTVDDERELVGYVKEVKWENKTRIIELIGKHITVNAFRDKVEHDVSDPLKKLYDEIAGRGLRPTAAPPGISGAFTPGLGGGAPAPSSFRPVED
ncbi:terminase small subunit [Phyllobacterium phragmitis]|uniref:Terminase small subunit n=1 Tax=Phyllobacterium phragmitis TaxID=2670329 RepID=A0A2S9INH6_9HYPH|nr:terminase small subunit [Phyllobacterium phragmitis]PRD42068.1 terminase small subunit [Phyllobacterium phragmitis]